VTEQPAETPARPSDPDPARAADGEFTPAKLLSRRQPGEPHPYMLEPRNPPNLWMLAAMTAGALLVAIAVMVMTILL
jgi:hypothetical protein